MTKKKSTKSQTVGTSRPSSDTPYVVLARKYRPQTFDDLIGQDAMIVTLRNAFAAGRIAQAYMLTGVRGVGKTTTARILARGLNFDREGAPDSPTTDLPHNAKDLGRHCTDIMESRHPDVIEMDAASNTGVDNIRELIESARYRPMIARYKVFIIDEVHMLSKGAFNALLKTLEEPPEHVKFIFATTEIRKVPVTVLSRCQRFDLRRVDVEMLAAHLKTITKSERAKADEEALTLIARAAEGSVRDALSILDQAIAYSDAKVTTDGIRAMLGLADRGRIFDLLEHVLGGRPAEALKAVDALYLDGAEPLRILTDLADTVHLATRAKVAGSDVNQAQISGEESRRAQTLADKLSMPLLARAWQMIVKGLEDLGRAPDQRAAVEMVLIRLAFTADLPAPDEIIKMLDGTNAPASSRNSAAKHPDARQQLTSSATRVTRNEPHLAETNATLQSFDDVVALAAENRDAKLKIHLEEHVSLVKFDASGGLIDLCLLPGAPSEMANELREKLNTWTGRRWVVALSKTPGAPAIGQSRRQQADAELERVKTHPAVKAALDAFPDAKIESINRIDKSDEDNDTGTG